MHFLSTSDSFICAISKRANQKTGSVMTDLYRILYKLATLYCQKLGRREELVRHAGPPDKIVIPSRRQGNKCRFRKLANRLLQKSRVEALMTDANRTGSVGGLESSTQKH